MKHLKRSFALLLLLTVIIDSRTFAQDSFKFASAPELMWQIRIREGAKERAKEVAQDNEYDITGNEVGIFLTNPLVLNGKPLDYGEFNLQSKGELTVIKAADLTGQTMQIPFYIYLRRNGNRVLIPGKDGSDPEKIKIDISEILRHAEPGDHLVIEPVRKEDGPVKRILKLLKSGC